MAVLDIRQRTGWLFMAIIVGHIILISAQVNTRRGVPILEEATFGVFAEVQRATTSVVSGMTDVWQNYFALQEVRDENARLKEQLAQLQLTLQRERTVAEQARALQATLSLRDELPLSTVAATVIGSGASTEFRNVTIDKGSNDGLGPDMAVIAPTGVVGRIVMSTPRASKVQLLIDRNAAAGALIERSRVHGLVLGTGGDRLRLGYIPGTADIKVGDRVVTSGIEGIYPASDTGNYPKGFVIGQIESIQRTGGEYGDVLVRPAADFAALESVLIVTSRPPSADLNVESGSGNAARASAQ